MSHSLDLSASLSPRPRRRTKLAAPALLLSLAVSLSACGGEDDELSGSADASPSVVAQEPVTTAPSTAVVAPPPAPTTTAAPAPPAMFAMPDFTGLDLQTAQNLVQDNGVFLSVSHDLLGSRNQVVDSNWIVCTQNIAAGQQISTEAEGEIDFGVVKREERCP